MDRWMKRAGIGLLVSSPLCMIPNAAFGAWPGDPLLNVPVCTAEGDQNGPVIVTDGSGGVIVCWSDLRSGSWDVYAQHVLADGEVDPAWPTDGLGVCTLPGLQGCGPVVSDGNGGVIVSWVHLSEDGADSDIYVQHLLAGGSVDAGWPTNGRLVSAAPGPQIGHVLITDGAGGAIVAWVDDGPGNADDIYAHRVLANGVLDPAWTTNGTAVCTEIGFQWGLAVASDGAGGAIVNWNDFRTGIDYDIYSQHVFGNGAIDPAWPVDGLALCSAVGHQGNANVIQDETGGAFAVWNDYRSGTDFDVYAHHVLSNGTVDPRWPIDGNVVCAVAKDQSLPMLVTDCSGGVIVCWMDRRHEPDVAEDPDDIYAQHILESGAIDPMWPPEGLALCVMIRDQESPSMVSDGAGGAIVVWRDERTDAFGNHPDIYAQRALAGGLVDSRWPENGVAICTAVGMQLTPVAATDGVGGAILSWWDYRSGSNFDIYAQRVESDGTLGEDVAAGACCTPEGSCSVTSELECQTPDVWQGDGTICQPNSCPQPGACCLVTFCTVLPESECQSFGGTYQGDSVACVDSLCITSAVDDPPAEPPDGVRISPNPTRGGTTVSFAVPVADYVSVAVFDAAGRIVRTLTDRSHGAGIVSLSWDGRDSSGREVPAGGYFVRITTERGTVARQIVLRK